MTASGLGISEGDLLAAALTGSSASFYSNYSPEDFFAYKDYMGEDWLVGENGVTFSTLLGDNREIIGIDVTAWRVTDSGGVFFPVIVNPVPEPSSLCLTFLGVVAVFAFGRKGQARARSGG